MVGVLDDRYMRRPGMIGNVRCCFNTASGQVGLWQQELDGLSAAPCVKDGGRSSEREVMHELASIVWNNIITLQQGTCIIFHHIWSNEHLSLCFTCFTHQWRMRWCRSLRYVNVNQIQYCRPNHHFIYLSVGIQLHQKVSLKIMKTIYQSFILWVQIPTILFRGCMTNSFGRHSGRCLPWYRCWAPTTGGELGNPICLTETELFLRQALMFPLCRWLCRLWLMMVSTWPTQSSKILCEAHEVYYCRPIPWTIKSSSKTS